MKFQGSTRGKKHHSCSSRGEAFKLEVDGVDGWSPAPLDLLQTPARPKAWPLLANSDSHFRTIFVEQVSPRSVHLVQAGFLVSQRTRLARHSEHPSRLRVFTGPARSLAFLRGIQQGVQEGSISLQAGSQQVILTSTVDKEHRGCGS